MQAPMQLLPQGEINLLSSDDLTKVQEQPTNTYRLDLVSGRVRGFFDAQEAMKQAIFLALQTWQNAHDIYNDQYGFEARGLVGHDRAYIESELKRRVKEALLVDARILEVNGFKFKDGVESDSFDITFSVKTRFDIFETSVKGVKFA